MSSESAPLDRLGDLSVTEFLATFWQKKPVLLKGVFPRGFDPIGLETLRGLATLEEADARLIVAEDWPPQLYHGPFEDEEFDDLPDGSWTLLVQEVDRLLPSLARVQDQFRFVPNWRLDDLMVSYATPGGGVGAHTDQYDVFLIQGMGRRRWEIGLTPNPDPDWDPESEVAVLADFTPDASWIVEPGDVLYLPPHFAHNGVALEPCVTLSVGFRAPAPDELLEAALGYLTEDGLSLERYVDEHPAPESEPGRLTPAFLAAQRALVRGLLADDAVLDGWIARRLTEPMRGHATAPEVDSAHQEGSPRVIRPVSAAQAAFTASPEGCTLYVAGTPYRLPSACERDLAALTGAVGLHSGANLHPDLAAVLTELLEEGVLREV